MKNQRKIDLFSTGTKVGRFTFRPLTPGVVNQMRVFGLDGLFDPNSGLSESEKTSQFFSLVYLLTAPLQEVVRSISDKVLKEKALELELIMTEGEVLEAVEYIVGELEKERNAGFDVKSKPTGNYEPSPPKN